MAGTEPLWRPDAARVAQSNMARFIDWLRRERGLEFADYDALWRWSVDDLEGFWTAFWAFSDLRSATPWHSVLVGDSMPDMHWFEGAQLNYVDAILRHANETHPAIIQANEAGVTTQLEWSELRRQVGALAATLRAAGVQPGDRVVAWLPNVPQTVVAFLACASLGAVWSVCSPDMGAAGVLDRFVQIGPVVLIACDAYHYAGRYHDRRAVLHDLIRALPSLRQVILLPRRAGEPDAIAGLPADLTKSAPGIRFQAWDDAVAGDAELRCTQVPFEHPLWIVYSSGTTGLPKAIVHGHGGTLLESLKVASLHLDLGPGDRFHWYTSTGWIMWNVQLSGMLTGATICLYDGSPSWPDWSALWNFVARERITFFGAGAAFYASCIKAGLEPRRSVDLSALRTLGSTGSPLAPEAYGWIYSAVKADLWLNPISGGTDFASAFLAGNPMLPVWQGEMQCRPLGAAVASWNEAGEPVMDEVGELVCTRPLPSMPLYFWGDPGKRRYLESYFETWPGVWRHGDWVRLVPRPGAPGGIVYGRSDTTINRHGIRMGTSELYRVVENIPEILDSLVVDLEYLGKPSWMPLFVVVREGCELDESLMARIRAAIRSALSPRHVPDEVLRVAEVPRTLSGKKLELPIKKLLLGAEFTKVANPDAMANPASLAWFVEYARKRQEAAAR